MSEATGEKQRLAPIWPWVIIGVIPLLYWFSLGPYVHWMQSARTLKAYQKRQVLGGDIYAPIFWLSDHDPTPRHAFSGLTENMVNSWRKTGFKPSTLPDK